MRNLLCPITFVTVATSLLIALAISLLTVFGSRPALPPLLQGVTAGGGYWGSCPPETKEFAHWEASQPAISPEFNHRLAEAIPIGSNEKHLTEMLSHQGFRMLPACQKDQFIKSAEFEQHGGLSPLTAMVFWKIDDLGRIVWTKGFVRYTAL